MGASTGFRWSSASTRRFRLRETNRGAVLSSSIGLPRCCGVRPRPGVRWMLDRDTRPPRGTRLRGGPARVFDRSVFTNRRSDCRSGRCRHPVVRDRPRRRTRHAFALGCNAQPRRCLDDAAHRRDDRPRLRVVFFLTSPSFRRQYNIGSSVTHLRLLAPPAGQLTPDEACLGAFRGT